MQAEPEMDHSPTNHSLFISSLLTHPSFELHLIFLRHFLPDLSGGLLDILPGFADYRTGAAGTGGDHVARHPVIVDAGGVTRGAIAIAPTITVAVVSAARRQ